MFQFGHVKFCGIMNILVHLENVDEHICLLHKQRSRHTAYWAMFFLVQHARSLPSQICSKILILLLFFFLVCLSLADGEKFFVYP